MRRELIHKNIKVEVVPLPLVSEERRYASVMSMRRAGTESWHIQRSKEFRVGLTEPDDVFDRRATECEMYWIHHFGEEALT